MTPPFGPRRLAVALALAGCAADGGTGPGAPDGALTRVEAEIRVFTHVRVVDPLTSTVESDRFVRIRDGVVEAVGPMAQYAPVPGAQEVDGGGRWLMPGLVDMHVHLRPADTEAYVRAGITRVRSMWGWPGLDTLVGEIEAGTRIGPRVSTLSPGIDAPPEYWPYTRLLTDPARADALVQTLADLGYRELKIYEDLSLEVYDAVAAAAEARGMTWAGHRPRRVPLEHVLQRGQRSVEHLGGYLGRSAASLDEIVALTVASGTWNCPTLRVQRILQGETPAAAERRRIVGALHGAGARLLVGTDAGIDATAPGTSLREEMAEFEAAGIPAPAILRMATVDAARYLGLDDRLGRIAPGRAADLVLLPGNPLADLDVLQRPLGVHLGRGWIDLSGR